MFKPAYIFTALISLAFTIIGIWVALPLFSAQKNEASFESLSSEEMHARIIQERNIAIRKAEAEGKYKCCIEPPCTMCYMEANEWNNHTPGTCACDDLIAEGKDPCPQCMNGLCSPDPEDNNSCSTP